MKTQTLQDFEDFEVNYESMGLFQPLLLIFLMFMKGKLMTCLLIKGNTLN